MIERQAIAYTAEDRAMLRELHAAMLGNSREPGYFEIQRTLQSELHVHVADIAAHTPRPTSRAALPLTAGAASLLTWILSAAAEAFSKNPPPR